MELILASAALLPPPGPPWHIDLMSRVVHFEIQADDVERAKAFYGEVFDWAFEDWSSYTGSTYWGITTGPGDEPGINGAIMARPAPAGGLGANAYVCTMQVEDYDAVEQRILGAGGKVALPKAALAGMAWQGYYLDPEGNTFGIHQPDPSAA
jgi:predicted enzyme related to lactoylglutathione lyase